MKKQLKILASAFAGLMLATSLASCDVNAIKDLFPFINEQQKEELEEPPKGPEIRRIHDFEDLYGERDWEFYNEAHYPGKGYTCGEIVDDGTGNHVMKIYGQGNMWEGIEFNAPRYLGIQSKVIKLKFTSSKEIEDLRFSLEYAKHQFMESTADISVGTNEIELHFEQNFSAVFSFTVKTKVGLYKEISIDDIVAIENIEI